MKTLHITVADKIATFLQRGGVIVCGNSDYSVKFTFDAEWDEYPEKTARFIWNGKYYDQKFTGNVCPAPIISAAEIVSVGVYAGELSTTTPAIIPCKESILCKSSILTDGQVQKYRDEILEIAENMEAMMEQFECLESTGDTTDRLAEMQAILDEHKYLKLGAGDFYLSGQLRIGKGAVLEGCGASTKIMQTPDSTQPSMIWLKSEGTIRSVCVQGAWTSEAEVTTTPASYRIGIVMAYGTHNAIIDSCYIRGWTYYGVSAQENGTATYSFIASNCDFCCNNVGMTLTTTEYACINHCVFHDNRIGVINNAGNNKFTACGFDSNVYGFYISDGYNNGHGNAVGCTFNHNEQAVHIENNEVGFVFSGCQFHFGDIYIYSGAKGTLFANCQFGNQMSYINYSANTTMFEGCIFSLSPKTDSVAYIDSHESFRFVDCINYNTGESVDNVGNAGNTGGVNIATVEKWTFTLADGTLVDKDVLIGSEDDTNTEVWVFKMNDGTEVRKAVLTNA